MRTSTALRMMLAAVAMLVAFAPPLCAQDLVESADPCTQARDEFQSGKERVLAAYSARESELRSMDTPPEEYRLAWNALAKEAALQQLQERFSGVDLSGEQLDQMSSVEVENYIRLTGESAVQQEIQTIFNEHRTQAIADLQDHRQSAEKELAEQGEELEAQCGNGTAEVFLRIALALMDQRFQSINSESSLEGKVVKFFTDISLEDIKKHGLLGGENSEARKIVRGIENVIAANIEASTREQGDLDKAIRATTGVSVNDIKEHGILGGKNSDARKVCEALFGSC